VPYQAAIDAAYDDDECCGRDLGSAAGAIPNTGQGK